MLCRTVCTLILSLPLLGVATGCDSRPKFVIPTEKAPPAPRPRVAGPGNGPAQPARPVQPDVDPKQKQPDANKPPADSGRPEDNQ
jgi:hypothetical protein